ncbi:hypothetical protein TaPaz_106 [Acinetobacter phage TaPaz]|nr:hypothetical protein TaPaz_106 [Acinetobacter phage TaPaz]
MNNILNVTLSDFLPTTEELDKFYVVYKNQEDILSVDIKEGDESLLSDYDAWFEDKDFDAETLFNSLFMSKVFYEAINNVEIVEQGDEN